MSFLTWLIAIVSSCLDWLRYWIWTGSPSTVELLEESASEAKTFEEWQAYQKEIDDFKGKQQWLFDDRSTHYDWKTLQGYRNDLRNMLEVADNVGLASNLRIHSSRNMCRILTPSLYLKSKTQTKRLIHEYISLLKDVIRHLARRESVIGTPHILNSQDKRQLFSDVRQTIGRTALLLQGGSTFSICHLGVVQALLERRLLPQIVIGTATGSLVSALICTTADGDLKKKLRGEAINLAAFDSAKERRRMDTKSSWFSRIFPPSLERRAKRAWKTGHLFDIRVIQKLAQDNLGDVTFEEAYNQTGRILNITVALSDVPGTPQLLNYITAPHVIIWSAVVASIATSKSMYAQVFLVCKSEGGEQLPFFAPDSQAQFAKKQPTSPHRSALERVGELFNVNHFIVSQTRPYLIPFLRLRQPEDGFWGKVSSTFFLVFFNEVLHWLQHLSNAGLLPAFLSRIMLDEAIPGNAHWSKITVLPELQLKHLSRMFEYPTAETVDEWRQLGERSTWPSICELTVRCGVEFELDRAAESVRRRVPAQINGSAV